MRGITRGIDGIFPAVLLIALSFPLQRSRAYDCTRDANARGSELVTRRGMRSRCNSEREAHSRESDRSRGIWYRRAPSASASLSSAKARRPPRDG